MEITNKIKLEEYAEKINMPVKVLTGKSRVPRIALARQTYWYYLHLQKVRLIDIARIFNRNSHSTIISGIRTVKNLVYTSDKRISLYIRILDIKP